MLHSVLRRWSADSVCGSRCRRLGRSSRGSPPYTHATSTLASPLVRQQREQAVSLERVIDGLEIDSLASLGFHGPDDIRGLVASERVRSAALVTVPIGSTLAVSLDGDGGQLSVLAPPGMPPNVKKAIEVVAGLIRETPDHQLLILAVLLLWARKYGSTAWREYCEAMLPPAREMSCLLCYTPGELSTLQLPHLVDEAARQHDWARWAHSQWLSSSSGALRRLGLADALEDTVWALAVVRSRAVGFQVGMAAGSGSGFKAGHDSGPDSVRLGRARRLPTGPVVSVLAPVVDLANHNNDPNCVIQLTTDKSRVVLLPRRPVGPGEPLTVDYGFDRSSLELMADYGFVTQANPYDGEVELAGADKLPSLELSRLEAAARALLRRHHQRPQRHSAATAPRRPGLTAAGDIPSSSGGKGDGCGEGMDVAGEGAATQEEEQEGGGSAAEVVTMFGKGVAISGTGAGAGDEADFSSRLRAAVAFLAPRTASFPGQPANSGNFSTPATQRIIAGLWHKLLRHCIESLPTSLEQDRALLEDIIAGAVVGFTAGLSLSLDPDAVSGPTSAFEPPPRPRPAAGGSAPVSPSKPEGAVQLRMTSERKAVGAVPGEIMQAAAVAVAAGERNVIPGGGTDENGESVGRGTAARRAGSATSSIGSGGAASAGVRGAAKAAAMNESAAVPPELTHGSRGTQDGGSNGESVATASTVVPYGIVGSSGSDVSDARSRHAVGTADVICRTGRRAGRLYAAVRARLEHKELLTVAEQVLVQYARN
ncbi:hypothetical protein Vretimale_18938 [Volvox reticuliferus]|uniref:SET domain-containing protein n=1 Tax=Volvox reticuliferus TaxID=1737510 RepID=A0A8J4CVG5_9CHLO|nr:hypothetical protein Vretifemale_17266 [Volvox reticuliferus]GIM16281.1 hypothetical protein Vretimale_18938 [Volvox reticuliferus]